MERVVSNPFEQALEEIERELKIREARQNYLKYVMYTNPGYKETKLHKYLCDEIDTFLSKKPSNTFDILLVSIPPQHGKLIADDQPILTTEGWTTHGELKVGDYVYSPEGKPIKVTNIHPKDIADIMVEFSNGEKIQCHENHEWVLCDVDSNKYKQKIVETKKILSEGVDSKFGNKSGRGHRYRWILPDHNPIEGKEKNLIVDPYTLGLWLGDGTTTKPCITMTLEDITETSKHIPYKVTSKSIHNVTKVNTWYFGGLRNDLDKIGVLAHKYGIRSKHIPDEYFTSSVSQRLELLSGLIDSDGFIYSKNGRTVFTTCDIMLKNDFIKLLGTFGWRATVCKVNPTTSTSGLVGKKSYWTISFQPKIFIPCKLKRKQVYVKAKKIRVSIKSITKVTQKQGNCITVEGGVYLVGDTMIPTHNSLTITETLPSYYIGRNPDKRVILVSYNEDFSIKFGRSNLRKIKEYHGDIFPECVLMESPCNNTEFETTKGGRCISRGISSGITGNPADLIIIDDPLKTRGEAESLVTRNNIYGEWLSSIRTRIAPGGKVVVIQTRWHEDDLYGKIMREERNVRNINLSCECETPEGDPLGRQKGDGLCPELGRGNDWLQEFKEVYRGKEGTRAWTSLYQGHPTSLEGNILKREWWRYYTNTDVDINKLPYKILSVDAAFKDGDDNDFVAIQLWGKINDNYYLIDYIEKHLDFIGTLEAIRDMHARHKDIWYTLIEDKANGSAIINVLSKEFDGIVPIKPEGGKVARANAVSFAIEAGRVWLPKLGAFVESFVEECSTFPNGIHDDAVDAMTQALNRMIHVDATVVNPKTIKYTEWTEDMFVDYENASDALKLELLDLWGHPQEWRE